MAKTSSRGTVSPLTPLYKWRFKQPITGYTVCGSLARQLSFADASPVLGRVESTYEPAMTKAFLHGRTEAIRTVQPESVHFVKVSPNVGYWKKANELC